jgi:hypothetical protein
MSPPNRLGPVHGVALTLVADASHMLRKNIGAASMPNRQLPRIQTDSAVSGEALHAGFPEIQVGRVARAPV